MSNFAGYLLKFGDVEFPTRFLALDSCVETPNQRIELEAKRDEYTQELIRTTSPYFKTKAVYNTIDGLEVDDLQEIYTAMADGLINETQRKYECTYWNSELLDYDTGYIYMPDIEFGYSSIDAVSNKLFYKSLRFAIIEY
jgi:hypothetical protein